MDTGVSAGVANLEQVKAWNGDEGAHWVEYADRYDAAVVRYAAHLHGVARISPGESVLDVGCGNGESTLQAARLAALGPVLGVDLSTGMVELARRRARGEGRANVEFRVADAQTCAFSPSVFDVVISRFGAMFFEDRSAAFGNIGRAMHPGGRLVLLGWRGLAENEWLTEIRAALAMGRTLPAPPVGAPGAFGMADPEQVHRSLAGSGYVGIGIEAVDEPFSFGRDALDALGFLQGSFGWLLHGLDEKAAAQAMDNLGAALQAHDDGTGVWFGSAAWLVTARRG